MKNPKKRRKRRYKSNPVRGANLFTGMMPKLDRTFSRYTGFTLGEAATLGWGGAIYGAANSLWFRTGATAQIHSMLTNIPFLPQGLSRSLPNIVLAGVAGWVNDRYLSGKVPRLVSQIISASSNGVVAASFVDMGVSLAQAVPGLNVPSMSGYVQSAADYGGIDITPETTYAPMAGVDYTPNMSGVDYTPDMSGVDYTPDMGGVDYTPMSQHPADFGQHPADFGTFNPDADFGLVPDGLN